MDQMLRQKIQRQVVIFAAWTKSPIDRHVMEQEPQERYKKSAKRLSSRRHMVLELRACICNNKFVAKCTAKREILQH